MSESTVRVVVRKVKNLSAGDCAHCEQCSEERQVDTNIMNRKADSSSRGGERRRERERENKGK